MNHHLNWCPGGLLALALALTAGCGRPKVVPSLQVAVEGQAAATVNRDANGDSLSVVVRVYFLKGKVEFSKLTFDMATSGRSDDELLGPDLLGRAELVLVPGGSSREALDLPPGTNYLGIAGFFRKPDPSFWRYLVSREQLKAGQASRKEWGGRKLPLLAFKAQDCFLALTGCKPETIPGQPARIQPECSGKAVYPPIDLHPDRP